MSGIVELLKAFDRKERAWLVRMALKPAALDQGFLNRVYKELDLTAPCSSTVWWGMDYHIDWLVAALHAFRNGWSVNELTTQKSVTNDNARITHSIEDFDFIIADKERIILIEAKAFGGWGKKQFKSKMDRLAKLTKEPEDRSNGQHEGKEDQPAKGTNDGKVINSKNNHSVQLHFVCTSITDSLSEKLKRCVPDWALIEDCEALEKQRECRSPAWVKLDVEPGQFMRVARSDDKGNISEQGLLWTIAKDREIKKSD